MRKSAVNKYCLIIPGKGYSPRAEHAQAYKVQIRRIAQKQIPEPFDGEVQIRVEYLYRNHRDRLDGDNLLKTICDALKGVAYEDDSQVVDQRVKVINMNASFTIRGLPLTQRIADLFENRQPFAITRLRKLVEKVSDEDNL